MTLYSELFLSRSSISCRTSSTFSWCEAVTCSQGQYYKLVSTGTFSFFHDLLTSSISPRNEERKMVVLRSAHPSSSFQFLFYHSPILLYLLAPSLPSPQPSFLIIPSTKASPHHLFTWRFFRLPMEYTDNKENKIFLVYKEIQMGASAKSYMRKGFLIYEENAQIFSHI
jgi:hypothetical protein